MKKSRRLSNLSGLAAFIWILFIVATYIAWGDGIYVGPEIFGSEKTNPLPLVTMTYLLLACASALIMITSDPKEVKPTS